MYNFESWVMGEIKTIHAYINDKKVAPSFTRTAKELICYYEFSGVSNTDSYFSNSRVSWLSIGDSVKIEVSTKRHAKIKSLVISKSETRQFSENELNLEKQLHQSDEVANPGRAGIE